MNELFDEDIFDKISIADAICITTNCSIFNGQNPMGALAGAAARRWNEIPIIYAQLLKIAGNVPCVIGNVSKHDNSKFVSIFQSLNDPENYTKLIAFPTMYNIAEPADFNLVRRSAELLLEMANDLELSSIYTGAPGCGVGGLSYDNLVRPMLSSLFDSRFYIMQR